MTEGILSRLIEEDLRKETEARSEEYMMVNVRPGEKVGALLELMSRMTGKTPSVLMAERLSEELAEHAQSSAAYGPAIFEAAAKALEQDGFWFEGALALLSERGVIGVVDNLAPARRRRLLVGPEQDSQ